MSLAKSKEIDKNLKDGSEERELVRRKETKEYRDIPKDKVIETGFKEKTEQKRVLNLPRVEGFDKSGIMTDQEVRDYLKDTLPEKHANNITMDSVRYSDQVVRSGKEQELGYWKSEKDAPFLQPDQDIVINKQKLEGEKGREQMKDTLTHEVGHQAYFKFLPESDRRDWGKLSGDRPRQECINEYARKNQYEDFAVSYRAYVRDPGTLKQVSQEKYNFMRDKVFEGREYRK